MTATMSQLRSLSIGEATTVRVRAWKKWNHTGIELDAGCSYSIRPDPAHYWIDFYITCKADGYTSHNAMFRNNESKRRAPNANWFALIGSYGESDNTFVIGSGTTLAADESAELVLYANDLPGPFYFNNIGYIDVTVTRES